MKNVLIGSFLGAIVFFLWGFIYWSILPTGPMIFGKTSDEEALAKQLKQSLPTAGTYYIPEPELMYSDEEEYSRRHQAGPVATVFIFPEGKPVMPARTFILGFLGFFASVLLMGFVLQMAAPVLKTYGSRVCLVLTAGLIGVALSDLGPPVWYWFPWGLWVGTAIFHITGWLLVSLILARFVKA